MGDIKSYYDEEMRYLSKVGRESAKEHPDSARRLALNDGEDCDPHVERLLEGFAFLTSRVRQSLDMEDDNLAAALLDMVAPGLERPLPAVAFIELVPSRKELSKSHFLRRGALVRARDPQGSAASIRFSLADDVEIVPMALVSAAIPGEGGDALELEFERWGESENGAWPDRFRLYLHGDQNIAWAMYYWLTRKVRSISLGARDAAAEVTIAPPRDLGCPSFGEDGCGPLLTMRDFLNIEDRFRFIEILGLSRLGAEAETKLRLVVRFRDNFPRALSQDISASLFRLHAVPAVNCFEDGCEPVRVDLAQLELPLRAASDGASEVLEVREVVGVLQSDPSRRRRYERLTDFGFLREKDRRTAYYSVTRHERRSGGVLTHLVVGDVDAANAPANEYLSVRALCCDGDAPREKLQPKDIGEIDQVPATTVVCRGLTRPTALLRPLDAENRRWKLLGFLRRAFQGLEDAELLRQTLRLLVWDGRESRRRLVDGIREVRTAPCYVQRNGIAYRIIRVDVALRDEQCTASSWERLGQLDAWGRLLWRIFSEEAPIGCGTRLVLKVEPAEVELEFGDV